jgi:hypothetical protein
MGRRTKRSNPIIRLRRPVRVTVGSTRHPHLFQGGFLPKCYPCGVWAAVRLGPSRKLVIPPGDSKTAVLFRVAFTIGRSDPARFFPFPNKITLASSFWHSLAYIAGVQLRSCFHGYFLGSSLLLLSLFYISFPFSLRNQSSSRRTGFIQQTSTERASARKEGEGDLIFKPLRLIGLEFFRVMIFLVSVGEKGVDRTGFIGQVGL